MIGMEARALKNLGQGGQLALWAPDSEFSNGSVITRHHAVGLTQAVAAAAQSTSSATRDGGEGRRCRGSARS